MATLLDADRNLEAAMDELSDGAPRSVDNALWHAERAASILDEHAQEPRRTWPRTSARSLALWMVNIPTLYETYKDMSPRALEGYIRNEATALADIVRRHPHYSPLALALAELLEHAAAQVDYAELARQVSTD